jgi:hypothetical protein
VKFRSLGVAKILTRNLLIYDLGGILLQFIGIADRHAYHDYWSQLTEKLSSMKTFLKELWTAIVATVVLCVVVSGVYPVLIWA